MNPVLTVFIPALNEEANLERCVYSVLERLDAWEVPVEVLIVNDGSQDRTAELAEALAQADARLHVFHHPQTLGLGGGFLTALQHAQGEWLILIPADLALNPDDLQRYLEAANGADIVVGLRSDRSDYTFVRRVVSWININLIRLLFGMRERQFQYISMYRLQALRQMKVEYWRSAFFMAEVLIKARALGWRLVEVEIQYVPRREGKATGARWPLILRTGGDLFHFWLRWIYWGPARVSRRTDAA